MRNRVLDEIYQLAARDPNLYLLVGDLGFSVIEPFEERFQDRFFNCGIAEQNMAAMAAGLALEGNTVFVYSIGNFTTLRCLEQIRNDVCYHGCKVILLSVGGGMSYGSLGMSHHATEDLSVMRALPGMRVYAPADPMEAAYVLHEAYRAKGPSYIRLARGSDPVLHEQSAAMGDVIRVSEGSRILLVSTGTILSEALRARELLRGKAIDAGLLSVPVVKPLDVTEILRVAEGYEMLVTIEENNLSGGFGSAVLEGLSSRGILKPVLRFGLPDCYPSIVGSQDYLRKQMGIDGEAIAEMIYERFSEIVS